MKQQKYNRIPNTVLVPVHSQGGLEHPQIKPALHISIYIHKVFAFIL